MELSSIRLINLPWRGMSDHANVHIFFVAELVEFADQLSPFIQGGNVAFAITCLVDVLPLILFADMSPHQRL